MIEIHNVSIIVAIVCLSWNEVVVLKFREVIGVEIIQSSCERGR